MVASVPVAVNRTLTRFAVDPPAFSPNADGRLDSLGYYFGAGAFRRTSSSRRHAPRSQPLPLFTGPLPAGEHAFTWTGAAGDGALAPDGRYTLAVQAATITGTVQQTLPVVLDGTVPHLSLLSRKPLRIRLSEPGLLVLTADGRRLVVTIRAGGSPASAPERHAGCSPGSTTRPATAAGRYGCVSQAS